MTNVDEKLCMNCGKLPIFAREVCGICYKRLVRSGNLTATKRGKSPNELSEIQKSVLIGSLLGDGWLSPAKPNGNSYLQINRSSKDTGYLQWEHDIFKDFCDKPLKNTVKYDKQRDQYYYGVSLCTRRSEVLKTYRNIWYPDGKKIVPHNIELNRLIVAIWLCDDGCIIRQSGIYSPTSPSTLGIKFATNAFSIEDVEYLSHLLSVRYNCKFYPNKSGTGYKIVGSMQSTLSVVDDVKHCIPSSMERKLKHYYDVIDERSKITNNPLLREYTIHPPNTDLKK